MQAVPVADLLVTGMTGATFVAVVFLLRMVWSGKRAFASLDARVADVQDTVAHLDERLGHTEAQCQGNTSVAAAAVHRLDRLEARAVPQQG